jgi:RNA polymerase sigma factor (sigma-70 family)
MNGGSTDGGERQRPGEVAVPDLEELCGRHRLFVTQIAGEYARRGLPFEDLLAEGFVGLIEAAQRFEPGYNVRFLTYAQWWIRKRVLDFIARESRVVRLTRYARDRRRGLELVRSELRRDMGREPTLEDLARATGIDEPALGAQLQRDPFVCSLDEPIGGDGRSLGESLVALRAGDGPEAIERAAMAEEVRAAIRHLPPRERLVLESRFAIDGREPMTFEDLGQILGLTRERVRQIEREAIVRLRRRFGGGALRPRWTIPDRAEH